MKRINGNVSFPVIHFLKKVNKYHICQSYLIQYTLLSMKPEMTPCLPGVGAGPALPVLSTALTMKGLGHGVPCMPPWVSWGDLLTLLYWNVL